MTIKRNLFAITAASALALAGLTGCQTNEGADDSKAAETTAAAAEKADKTKAEKAKEEESEAPAEADAEAEGEGAVAVNARPDECGLQEQQGPEGTFGPFDISVKFFQPGQMAPAEDSTMKMLDYADSQMHLEVDTKANAFGTNWGWSVDETPAGLRMFYELTDESEAMVSEGMMMPMNAIDGSHYGTNLAKDTITKPGMYTMKLTVYPPQNYDLHADYITGVPADGWFKPLTLILPWEITQENLDKVAELTVDNPMDVPDNCKEYPKKMFEDSAAQKAMDEAAAVEPVEMKHMH